MTPANRFALRGYQFDIDGPKRYIGQNYEEKGRLFMAMRGQVTRVVGGRPPVVVASIGDEAQLATLATDDWNAVHLIVRGNTLMHFLNGRLLSMTIDDDAREPAGRRPDRDAGARRAADEGRVPQHPAEDVVRPRRPGDPLGLLLEGFPAADRLVGVAARRGPRPDLAQLERAQLREPQMAAERLGERRPEVAGELAPGIRRQLVQLGLALHVGAVSSR